MVINCIRDASFHGWSPYVPLGSLYIWHIHHCISHLFIIYLSHYIYSYSIYFLIQYGLQLLIPFMMDVRGKNHIGSSHWYQSFIVDHSHWPYRLVAPHNWFYRVSLIYLGL